MSSTQPAAAADPIAPGRIAGHPDHPGINKLFALLAYGEVAAFYRLTDEARMAPNMRGRIAMASMAAAEMRHYEVLGDALSARGIDVEEAMTGYVSALENYHRLTTPSTWLEALVKTYIGDALAADFYREIGDVLPAEVAGVVRGGARRDGSLAVRGRRGACGGGSSGKQRNRLTLWARRLLGEAITQAQFVLAEHDELADLVVSGTGGLGHDHRVLRSVAAHACRADGRTRSGIAPLSGCRSSRWC